MTSLHWQTSLQTQKGHALMQLHNWSMSTTLMYWRWLCYFAYSRRPYMVHRPTRVGTVGSCVAFERDSPGALGVFFFPPGRTLKQCRTHQGWLSVRMVGTARSQPPPGTWQSWSAVHGVDVPWRGSGIPELHAGKTACDLDMSRSLFRGCATTSQGPPWLAESMMHRNGSGSAVSRHQSLAETPGHKVSWLLCIGRLVSKHRKVMHLHAWMGMV